MTPDSTNERTEVACSPQFFSDHAWNNEIPQYVPCYAAGLKQLPVPGEPHRPKKIVYASMYWEVRPSFLVDISPYFDRKIDAINCFASQFAGDLRDITELYPAWGKLIDRITTQCKYFGHLMGVNYAEPFVVKEVMAVEDIVNLPVASI